jgi:hypothetical protein
MAACCKQDISPHVFFGEGREQRKSSSPLKESEKQQGRDDIFGRKTASSRTEKRSCRRRALDLLHAGSEASPPGQHGHGELRNLPLAGRDGGVEEESMVG